MNTNNYRADDLAEYLELLLKADINGFDVHDKVQEVLSELHEQMGFRHKEDKTGETTVNNITHHISVKPVDRSESSSIAEDILNTLRKTNGMTGL